MDERVEKLIRMLKKYSILFCKIKMERDRKEITEFLKRLTGMMKKCSIPFGRL